MTNRAILLWLGVAAALLAMTARADDLAARALRERQQQSDAFSLQLQQSIQSFRAGNLAPRERLELDALQRDQRLQQDRLFDRQGVEANSPGTGAARRAEALRAEQERQQQLSRFRSAAAPAAEGKAAAQQAAPLVDPRIATAPIPRGPRRAPGADPGAAGP